jgi:DNA-binding transcriptional ArsR family regulator
LRFAEAVAGCAIATRATAHPTTESPRVIMIVHDTRAARRLRSLRYDSQATPSPARSSPVVADHRHASPGAPATDHWSRCRLCTGKSSLAYTLAPLSDVFHALAAPARRAILDELHDRDGQTLFELCTRLTMKHELGLSRQAISQHLQVLEDAGLVSFRRDGRYKFHYLDTTPLEDIARRWSVAGGKGDGSNEDQPRKRPRG